MARRKKNSFDPTKPRALNMKIRCSGPKVGVHGFPIEGEKCGAVYLKIVENEDNPTALDLRTTHKKCPVCGSTETENLTDYELGNDGTRVIVKHREI